METICEAKELMVVQGDLLEEYFPFTGIEPSDVESVSFISRKEGLEVDCPYVEGAGYLLKLTSEMTEPLTPKICSYDLMAKLADGNVITPVSKGCFAVLKRRNPPEDGGETVEPEPGGGEQTGTGTEEEEGKGEL